VLAKLLKCNRGPSGERVGERATPKYFSSLHYDGEEFAAVLKFESGQFYCCLERSCHIGFQNDSLWTSIRSELARLGQTVPDQFRLEIETIIEDDAMFFDLGKPVPDRKGWYKFGGQRAMSYKEYFVDGVIVNDM